LSGIQTCRKALSRSRIALPKGLASRNSRGKPRCHDGLFESLSKLAVFSAEEHDHEVGKRVEDNAEIITGQHPNQIAMGWHSRSKCDRAGYRL
jgi:hypothetical protein